MHIPDSVLSPAACAVAGVAMMPVWSVAACRVRTSLGTRQMPLLALGASFSFTVMMFNIPALGGFTAHPVAGTLLAVLLGPWAACIGISVALLIQAMFFGDGGLLAYGANCLTMAFILPFAGYSVYWLLARATSGRPAARPICAAAGSFVGINAAAATVAVILGVQPWLFHEANGHALYFPFGISITMPAMLAAHLLVAGPAEAVVTAMVVRYLQSAGIPLYGCPDTALPGPASIDPGLSPELAENPPAGWARRLGRPRERLWIGLLIIAACTPLGLLARGDAFGEWDARGIAEQTERRFGAGHGYTPKGTEATEARGYHGIRSLQDYAADDGRNRLGYVGSALLGVSAITGLTLAGGMLARRRAPATPAKAPAARSIRQSSPAGIDRDRLPKWLTAPAEPLPAAAPRSRQNQFIERSLSELLSAAGSALQSDRWAGRPGLLQGIDARAKVITLLLLILVTGLTRRPVVLIVLYGLALALGLASQLPIALLLRRVWLTVPLFVGAVALPLSFAAVTPGRELLVLWRTPLIAISQPGAVLAATLTLRVGAAVTFAILLTLTTRWNDLLQALRVLGVPRMFLSVLAMTYRYLGVTVQTALESFTARRSRTAGPTSNRDGRKYIGAGIGALFGKSLAMAEEVHGAMVSRGFRGEMRTLAPPRWRLTDSLWTVVFAAAATALWFQG